MKQIRNFGDERQVARCTYCGLDTTTRDHVPSRVLLDEPYPENLPVVPACRACNTGFSADEEYVACLIECAVSGSTSLNAARRDKIRRILNDKPALAARIAGARAIQFGNTYFRIENDRVRNMILKLGRGHVVFELNEPHCEDPLSVDFAILPMLSLEARQRFEHLPTSLVWPEVGSRAMQRLAAIQPSAYEWLVVQPARYRYVAMAQSRVVVRMVMSEYLACEVTW